MSKKEDPVPRTQLGGQLILGKNEQKGGPCTQDIVIGGQLISRAGHTPQQLQQSGTAIRPHNCGLSHYRLIRFKNSILTVRREQFLCYTVVRHRSLNILLRCLLSQC